ncbi:hypothetical protein IV203_036014 [Nitzschia inconspicua]|uniref:Uncharacterized protein n=1 Tax=Nitzschia inconspicua TaxID=303405 RepID=A0A9K3LFI5_9STRA|nr:hypothetical protein IV203_036014 [Nitzschia inconspicua]
MYFVLKVVNKGIVKGMVVPTFFKLRAVTGYMAHSAQGAKTARQKMVAMAASLGLPCVFFPISPEDGVNFRIRVLSKGEKGSEYPPGIGLDEEINRQFLMGEFNVLTVKFVRRNPVKNRRPIDIEVNGTLENVCAFADIYFLNDKYQKKAFEFIICAFIDQLYKQAKGNVEGSGKVQMTLPKKRKLSDITEEKLVK